jgi:hypothetical protein
MPKCKDGKAVYYTRIAGPAHLCQIIIIFTKNPFGKTNFNLQYFN